MKISVELDDKDWGKVAVALESRLGRERHYLSDSHGSREYELAQAKRVAIYARIKQSVASQRRAGRMARASAKPCGTPTPEEEERR